MNTLRSKINIEELGLKHEGIYIGNKIVQGEYEGQKYFDISVNKEIFLKQGDRYWSLSDFSNIQRLWKHDSATGNLLTDEIVVKYQEFPLFTESEKGIHYAVMLRAAWKYLGGGATIEQVKEFVLKYNKKLLPIIYKHIKQDDLQIKDWWYCGGEFTPEEDLVEIVSTTPENLSFTLAAVSGNLVNHNSIAKRVMR